MKTRKVGDTIVLRCDIGEDIYESIDKLANDENIGFASIQGIGATNDAILGYYNIETCQYADHIYDGFYEIVSLLGNISRKDGNVHVHLHSILSDEKGHTHGGHVKKLVVGATSEIFIRVFDNVCERTFDEHTKLYILDL